MSIIPALNLINYKLLKHTDIQISVDKLDLSTRHKLLGHKNKAERCANCGSFLDFNIFVNKIDEKIQASKLTNANFCRDKFCVRCAINHQRKFLAKVRSILKQLEESYKVRYIFLTLTIKNPPISDLRNTLNDMSKGFNKLVKSKEFKSNVLGYVRGIEVLGDNTKQGEAHPHYHCLLAVKPSYFSGKGYMTQAKWSELWKRSLQVDYMPVVDVRTIKPNKKVIELEDGSKMEWSALDSAMVETLKYMAKPSEIEKLNLDHFADLDYEMKGIRQYSLGGLCKKIQPKQEDDLNEEEWKIIGRCVYEWIKSDKKYNFLNYKTLDKTNKQIKKERYQKAVTKNFEFKNPGQTLEWL